MTLFGLIVTSSFEYFNLTLAMPNIQKSLNNQSVYIAMKLPSDEELYIVDFYPMINFQTVRFITTYLCSKPYSKKENFWFETQPCQSTDQSMLIYEWYHNIPAVKWPKDAGLRVGTNTPYRYIVVNIDYSSSVLNDIYGEQITLSRQKPKYKIGSYDIVTNTLNIQKNRADFSCQYDDLSSIQIFSTSFFSNFPGRSISLYRVRNNQSHSIIKGNLSWPQTFYQLSNSIDIKTNDFLIGTCVYEKKIIGEISKFRDLICQLTLMFYIKQEEKLSIDECQNNQFPYVVNSFLPTNFNDVPQTLFDINPIYPKLSPNDWATIQMNKSSFSSKSTDANNTHIFYLIYSNDNRHQQFLDLLRIHRIEVLLLIWLVLILIGLIILIIVICRSRKIKIYKSSQKKNRSKAIIVGGETSSLSGWLTKRRFQQYGDNDDAVAREPLTSKHRWTSDTDGSELSDTDVFNSADFQQINSKK